MVDIATAWATSNDGLSILRDRVKNAVQQPFKVRAVVGLWGNITNPETLKSLHNMDEKSELRICEEDRFHPKVYIFQNGKKSVSWVGSANFTSGGFGLNEEILLEVSNEEDIGAIREWFESLWERCGPLQDRQIEEYEERRKKDPPKPLFIRSSPPLVESILASVAGHLAIDPHCNQAFPEEVMRPFGGLCHPRSKPAKARFARLHLADRFALMQLAREGWLVGKKDKDNDIKAAVDVAVKRLVAGDDSIALTTRADIERRTGYYWLGGKGPDVRDKVQRLTPFEKRDLAKRLTELMGAAGKYLRIVSPVELFRNISDWKTYYAALRELHDHKKWPPDAGRNFSVLGETDSWYHTIKELRPIVRKNWTDLNGYDRKRLLGLINDDAGIWALLGRMRNPHLKAVFQDEKEWERIQSAIMKVVDAKDTDFPGVAIEAYQFLIKDDGNGKISGVGTGIVTRLFALARPDRLVSLNDQSQKGLAKIFELPRTTLKKPKNYEKLLERLYEKPWFNTPPPQPPQNGPEQDKEHDIWSMRAALIDCFVYDP